MNSFSDSKNVFGLWPKASHDARPSAERRLNTIHRDQSVRDGIRAASAERLRRAKVGTVGRISGTKTSLKGWFFAFAVLISICFAIDKEGLMRYFISAVILISAIFISGEVRAGEPDWKVLALRSCRAAALPASGTDERGFTYMLDAWRVENPKLQVVFTGIFEGSKAAVSYARFYLSRASAKADAALKRGDNPMLDLGVPESGERVQFGGIIVFCSQGVEAKKE